MAEFPRLTDPLRVPWDFRPGAWIGDHRYRGRVVLPAVESLRLLADGLSRHLPGHPPGNICMARFHRFLYLEDLAGTTALTVEFSRYDGGVRARLLRQMKGRRISRMLEHAEVRFAAQDTFPEPPPLLPDRFFDAGDAVPVEPERLYRDLVPFGPAYHTVQAPLVLSGQGAAAVLVGRGGGENKDLGSPFYLDGAFHVACAWGQRYADAVTFPVAIGRYRVVSPIHAGTACRCVVLPKGGDRQGGLLFDIWILDDNGQIREAAVDVEMKDVSRGALRPPGWIRNTA